jgi:hypothetical protein
MICFVFVQLLLKERSDSLYFTREKEWHNKKKMNEQNKSMLNSLFNRCLNPHVYMSLKELAKINNMGINVKHIYMHVVFLHILGGIHILVLLQPHYKSYA